ncbi:hypothetical protein NDU88_005916 [Pleurodeles waltl]|uniref:Uncharacterized protein n=1 Tax=Pleurodeles waltl TaxID=8319 RepID=A0AAV7ULH8_PLEWA|nr:hypothetical protein NDU88_005916 [Pleurodeles waltl]
MVRHGGSPACPANQDRVGWSRRGTQAGRLRGPRTTGRRLRAVKWGDVFCTGCPAGCGRPGAAHLALLSGDSPWRLSPPGRPCSVKQEKLWGEPRGTRQACDATAQRTV